jgi:hypothetical protein
MAVTLKKEAAANEKQSVNNAARLQRLFETWKDDEDEDEELMTSPDDQTNNTSTCLKTANSTDINSFPAIRVLARIFYAYFLLVKKKYLKKK